MVPLGFSGNFKVAVLNYSAGTVRQEEASGGHPGGLCLGSGAAVSPPALLA